MTSFSPNCDFVLHIFFVFIRRMGRTRVCKISFASISEKSRNTLSGMLDNYCLSVYLNWPDHWKLSCQHWDVSSAARPGDHTAGEACPSSLRYSRREHWTWRGPPDSRSEKHNSWSIDLRVYGPVDNTMIMSSCLLICRTSSENNRPKKYAVFKLLAEAPGSHLLSETP